MVRMILTVIAITDSTLASALFCSLRAATFFGLTLAVMNALVEQSTVNTVL